jgi:hypothetical protein
MEGRLAVTEQLPRFMRATVVDAYGPPENVRLARTYPFEEYKKYKIL